MPTPDFVLDLRERVGHRLARVRQMDRVASSNGHVAEDGTYQGGR